MTFSTGAALRHALPRAYYAFFGRHGQPRTIQLEAAQPLLAGRDALLMAPSASGKTEAALAPLCERLLTGGKSSERKLLVVTPTRALASDLHRRVSRPLEDLELAFGRWTGDHKEPASRKGGGELPAVTIVTPESLDSLLSRRVRVLIDVTSLFIDELHVIDGTPRGAQLRVLLGRLRHACAVPPQVVAASATVAHAEEMAARYLCDATLIRESRRHVIKVRLVKGVAPPVVARTLEELCGRGGIDKVLLFANRRDLAEHYAAELQQVGAFDGEVFAHHGSLSRSLRESVEARFLAAPRALCVATMTLELGIDIGDVDLVGLLAPPNDVSSLIQRIGRSGRRGSPPRAVCFSADEAGLFRFRSLLELAADGDLAEDPAVFQPSVLVQQAISLLHQNRGGWVTAVAIHARLDAALAKEWTVERLESLLAYVAEGGKWLEARGGRYVAGEKTERLWRRGLLHSNISDQSDVEVVDQLTGETLGTVAFKGGERAMRFGGKSRRIVHEDGDRIVVGGAAGGEPPRFAPRGVPLVSRALSRALRHKLELEANRWPVVPLGDGEVALFHFGGTAWGVLIAAALAAAAEPASVRRPGPFAVVVGEAAPLRVPRPCVDELRDLVSKSRKRLARVLGMGPYHRELPTEEGDAALCEAIDVDALARALAATETCVPPESIAVELWCGLG